MIIHNTFHRMILLPTNRQLFNLTLYIVQNSEFDVVYQKHTNVNVISRQCFSLIASFYVQLHSSASPCQTAIKNMNTILQIYPLQNTKIHKDVMTVPVIANFTAGIRRNLSHHQHWLLLHCGTMHTSSSTLKHIITKKLLNDIHPTLLNQPSYDCTCTICQLSKPTLSARGNLVNKSNFHPFQRIHVDFSFLQSNQFGGLNAGNKS